MMLVFTSRVPCIHIHFLQPFLYVQSERLESTCPGSTKHTLDSPKMVNHKSKTSQRKPSLKREPKTLQNRRLPFPKCGTGLPCVTRAPRVACTQPD